MSAPAERIDGADASDAATGKSWFFLGIGPRQWVKIVVYSLLLVNFLYYLAEDLEIAAHTASASWSLLDWSGAFATSLDEVAWFLLLFLFELETYLLSDQAFTRGRVLLMHALRLVCFLFIAHTVYAYLDYLFQLQDAQRTSGSELCAFVDRDISFARNLVYTDLDALNCQQLSRDSVFYLYENGEVITDQSGMQVEMELAWVDVVESITWLMIVLLIELVVRLQERGVSEGLTLRCALAAKVMAYGLLWCAALHWAWRGHWLYVWDEALWILGFMAIDMNLSAWRDEIDADQ